MYLLWITLAAVVYFSLLGVLLLFLAGAGKANDHADQMWKEFLRREEDDARWHKAA